MSRAAWRTSAPRATGSFPGRRGARRRLGVLGVALVVVGGPGACGDLRPLHGTVYDPPRPAPALRLARADGSAFDLGEQRGRVVAVFFGYTNCPDVCPTTLADLARVANALDDEERARFRVVFVSVDPGRDTPAVAEAYARRFHPSFVGVTGAESQLLAAARAFGVAAMPLPAGGPADTGAAAAGHAGHGSPASPPQSPAPGGYQVLHGGSLFLVDREGRLRTVHPTGSPVADVLADVRSLVD